MHSSVRAATIWFSKLRWSLLLLAGAVVAILTHNFSTVLIVFGVIVMVMVHEFGHFITAKLSGMKVTEYFLGFGPKLWSKFKGETEYGVKAIPAGGYVKIVGMNNIEEVDPADEARTYRQQPFSKRIIVVCAGSFMHFVMAFLLAFAVFAFIGQERGDDASNKLASVSNVQNSPSAKAGLREGDRVTAVNGAPIKTWNNLTAAIKTATVGTPIQVDVTRGGKPMSFTITPIDRREVRLNSGALLQPNADPKAPATPFLGLSPVSLYKTFGPIDAAGKSGSMMWHDSGQVVKSLTKVFSPSGLHTYYQNVTGTLPEHKVEAAQQTRFLSPVGLVGYAHDAARSGWSSSLLLLYAINLFVGIFNMTPLLPFDGGHVAIALYEKVRSVGKKRYYMADFNKMLPVSYAVLLVLVVISLSSLWLDIVNPAPNPFQ